jgi:hypothetical protein
MEQNMRANSKIIKFTDTGYALCHLIPNTKAHGAMENPTVFSRLHLKTTFGSKFYSSMAFNSVLKEPKI